MLSFSEYINLLECLFLEKELSQPKLNIIKWRAPSGEDKVLRLKQEMSVVWWTLGQNIGISNAELSGFQQFHQNSTGKCMDSVIQKWIEKGSPKVKKLCAFTPARDCSYVCACGCVHSLFCICVHSYYWLVCVEGGGMGWRMKMSQPRGE